MNNNDKVWSNGELIPFNDANVHLLSHGFSRSSAVFEFFGVQASPTGISAFRMQNHLNRLKATCNMLGMTLGYDDTEIARGVKEVVCENKITNGFVKIMGYYSEVSFTNMIPEGKLDVSIFTMPAEDNSLLTLDKTVTTCLSKWRKNHPLCVPPMAKACANYLNGYLARLDASQKGYDIGILLDTHGFVAEGSLESVFIVKDNVLITPPLGRVLDSISRKTIIEIAQALEIEVNEPPILPDDLVNADEMFLSATPNKIIPVTQFEDKQLQTPGPVTLKIAEYLFDVLRCKESRFLHWFTPL